MSGSPTDDFLLLLADSCRRRLLEALLEDPDASVRLDACLDGDVADTEVEWKPHIEMLESAGAIEFDADSRTVTAGERFDRVEPYVRAVSNVTRSDQLEHPSQWDEPATLSEHPTDGAVDPPRFVPVSHLRASFRAVDDRTLLTSVFRALDEQCLDPLPAPLPAVYHLRSRGYQFEDGDERYPTVRSPRGERIDPGSFVER